MRSLSVFFLVLAIANVSASVPFERLVDNLQLQVTASTFSCTNAIYDCSNNGYCNRNGTACVCDKGYATFECNPSSQCCYDEMKRAKFFVLAFFTAWMGAPYFVTGSIGMGVGILLLCCCGCVLAIVGHVWNTVEDSGYGFIISIIGTLAVISAFGWYISVWVQIAAETEPYGDKNGMPIAPWR